jgi:uncharacterized phiE125 gp8 family phage protein
VAEPVTLALAKEQIGLVDDTSRDALITGYITAAVRWVENYTGHILDKREVREAHQGFSRFFPLRWEPIDADTIEISYTDADGAPQTVSETIVGNGRAYPAYGDWWPSARLYTPVTVTYTAGYAAGQVPAPLIQAVLMLVAHWFAQREAGSERPTSEVPFGVISICDQYRMPV